MCHLYLQKEKKNALGVTSTGKNKKMHTVLLCLTTCLTINVNCSSQMFLQASLNILKLVIEKSKACGKIKEKSKIYLNA